MEAFPKKRDKLLCLSGATSIVLVVLEPLDRWVLSHSTSQGRQAPRGFLCQSKELLTLITACFSNPVDIQEMSVFQENKIISRCKCEFSIWIKIPEGAIFLVWTGKRKSNAKNVIKKVLWKLKGDSVKFPNSKSRERVNDA